MSLPIAELGRLLDRLEAPFDRAFYGDDLEDSESALDEFDAILQEFLDRLGPPEMDRPKLRNEIIRRLQQRG